MCVCVCVSNHVADWEEVHVVTTAIENTCLWCGLHCIYIMRVFNHVADWKGVHVEAANARPAPTSH